MKLKSTNDRTNLLAQQRELPRFVGTFYDVFIMTSPMMSPVNYLLLSSTTYAVTRDWLIVWFPWVTFPVFLGIIVLFYLLGMLFVYKFLYAAYFAHRNNQEYKHKNPIREDIAKAQLDIDKIKRALKIE